VKLRKTSALILALLLLIPTVTVGFAAEGEAIDITSEVEWFYRAFGQSTDLRFHNSASVASQDGINNVWVNPEWFDDSVLRDATPVDGKAEGLHPSLFTESARFIPTLDDALAPDTAVTLSEGDRLVLESRGGKITGGHDGITYFYTALPTDKLYRLSADITKSSIGSHPDAGSSAISNQTGAGIMARDFVPANRAVPYIDGYEEPPSCSNFVGTGIWQNNDTSRPGYAIRSGVVVPYHGVGSSTLRGAAGGDETTNPTTNSAVGLTFRYTLEHKNDGFYYSVTSSDGETVVVPETKITSNGAAVDMLMNIDEDTAYWGFAASREIRILVENVLLEETGDAEFTHEAPVVKALYPDAGVDMRSRAQTGLESYELGLRPNYDGSLIVKKTDANGEMLYDGAVTAYNEQWIITGLEVGENSFYYEFATQDANPEVKSATGTVTVTRTEATALTSLDTVWVSPEGAGEKTGVDKANAAPVSILAQAGAVEPGQKVYLTDAAYGTIAISAGNSGSKGGAANIYDGNRVAIMPEPGVYQVRASNVTLENQSVYVHIKGILAGGTAADSRLEGHAFNFGWSDYILIENCSAQWTTGSGFRQNSGQGVHKGTWAKYNTYLNCEATHNEDAALADSDGFQLQGFGIGNRYIGCVASYAGDDGWDLFLRVADGPGGSVSFENCIAYSNNANGFKLGGEGQPTPVTLTNCLAYDNGMAGFSDNFNPGAVTLTNCVAIDNATQNYIMRDNPNVAPSQSVIKSVSFRSAQPEDFFIDAVAGTVTDSALILDAWDNSVWDGEVVTADDFASLDRSLAYTRSATGALTRGKFARFLPTFDLTANWTNKFTDVSSADSFYEAVAFVNFYNLFAGTGATAFSPDMGMTRGMFATVLWALEEKPEPAETGGFGDVAGGEWYEKAVYWASENMIAPGVSDETYEPEGLIDAQQINEILLAYAEYKEYTVPDGLLASEDATRAGVAQTLMSFLKTVVGGY
jgi:hypothetical protein